MSVNRRIARHYNLHTYQESKEHAKRREKMPDVMVVKETQQSTVFVYRTRFGWCNLRDNVGDLYVTNTQIRFY